MKYWIFFIFLIIFIIFMNTNSYQSMPTPLPRPTIKPIIFDNSNIPTIKRVKKHGHIIIESIKKIKNLKYMKTYVLFPDNLSHSPYNKSQKYRRYNRVLSIIQETEKYILSELSLNKNINQFILLGREGILDYEKLTLDTYNYKLSNLLISVIKKHSMTCLDSSDNIECLSKKVKYELSFLGEGPFLITTVDNIVDDRNISYLYVDLGEFNNSAIDEIINSYKEHLEDKGNSEFTTLEKLKHKILALITNANEHIRIVKTAVAGDFK